MPENPDSNQISEALDACSITEDNLLEKEQIDSKITNLKIKFLSIKRDKENKRYGF